MHSTNTTEVGASVPNEKVAGGYHTTTATSKEYSPIFSYGLNENNIPPEHLPKARAWFQRQMDRCAAKHGDNWPEHREWLAEYFNEELREHLESKGARHGL